MGSRLINKVLWVSAILILWGCASQTMEPPREGKLLITPEKVVIEPGLLKNPIKFNGSGFGAKEMVVVEMVVPPGVEMKGVKKGEDVGLAYATCDEAGNFEVSMAPTATLNWLFRTEWSPILAPDLKQAKPLPPGKYEIRATGVDTGVTAKAYLEVQAPQAGK
jgi:hypothetical protein